MPEGQLLMLFASEYVTAVTASFLGHSHIQASLLMSDLTCASEITNLTSYV